MAGGVAFGAALYYGLVTVPMRHLFTVTSVIILLLAAGMASQGAAFLLQADLVPSLGGQLWDTSSLVAEQSLLGQILHALVGYVARPAGIQVLAYVATLGIIGGLMHLSAAASRRGAAIHSGASSLTPGRTRRFTSKDLSTAPWSWSALTTLPSSRSDTFPLRS